jgi:hypothetical protein
MAPPIALLVERRTHSFSYLQEVFRSERHWVSIVSLSKEESPDDPQGELQGRACRFPPSFLALQYPAHHVPMPSAAHRPACAVIHRPVRSPSLVLLWRIPRHPHAAAARPSVPPCCPAAARGA